MKKSHLLFLSGVCTTFSCSHNSGSDDKSNQKSANEKPNIIFIMADDLGYGDLGCYGQQLIKTPNIDSLAAGSMKFSQCYSGSSVSAPSRSVLMTGMHTGHTTVRGNFGEGGVVGLGGGEGRVPLHESDTTLAQILKSAGYVTAMVGKWGIGEPKTPGEPYKKGFDEFYGFLNQRRAHTYFPEYIWKDTVKVELPKNKNHKKNTYTHDLYAEYALDFIQRNQDTSFFLYLPFCLPHDEYEIPELGIYANKEWGEEQKAYAAMVTRLDYTIGQIAIKLKQCGINENTYLFITSDNGATNIDEGWEIFKSNAPLKGEKRDAYEGGIRVPMIVHHPTKIKPGENKELVWYFADVLPTIAQIANAKAPHAIDGLSVLPTLLAKNKNLEIVLSIGSFMKKMAGVPFALVTGKPFSRICITKITITLNYII